MRKSLCALIGAGLYALAVVPTATAQEVDLNDALAHGAGIVNYAPPPPPPQSVAAIVADEAAQDGINPDVALCVARKETGLTPTTRGYYVGLFQLGPGELSGFYARGFTDWADPRQQTAFFAARLHEGADNHTWPTLIGCR